MQTCLFISGAVLIAFYKMPAVLNMFIFYKLNFCIMIVYYPYLLSDTDHQ